MPDDWKLDNPAGRLHEFFSAIRRQNGDAQLVVSLGAVWGLPQPYLQPDLCERTAIVSRLPDEIEARITDLGDQVDKDYALRHKEEWERALLELANLHALTAGLQHLVPAESLLTLEHCARELHRHDRQAVVDQDTLTWIREQVDDLLAELGTCTVDPDLRRFLVDRLRDMQDAVDEVRLAGPDALLGVVDRLTGGVVRWKDLIVSETVPAPPRAWWSKIGNMMAKVTTVTTVAANLTVLGEAGANGAQAVAALLGHPVP